MSNKSNGTAFEREWAQTLADHGFWAHCLKDNANGQPFDVIAARNGKAYAFDCKECQYNDFSLYRIEENQLYAMRLWRMCGNGEGMFVINLPYGIRLLKCSLAEKLIESGYRRLKGRTIIENTIKYEEWLTCK